MACGSEALRHSDSVIVEFPLLVQFTRLLASVWQLTQGLVEKQEERRPDSG
jgi:hypothetical protein